MTKSHTGRNKKKKRKYILRTLIAQDMVVPRKCAPTRLFDQDLYSHSFYCTTWDLDPKGPRSQLRRRRLCQSRGIIPAAGVNRLFQARQRPVLCMTGLATTSASAEGSRDLPLASGINWYQVTGRLCVTVRPRSRLSESGGLFDYNA